jgi:hypothetical protein
MMATRPIFLLTDFGAGSYYPGVMKAVILGRNPGLRVEDLGHGVHPGAVLEGAFILAASWPYLPLDAVVVTVVDPGVGTSRRILAARIEGRTALAPDNGVLTGVLERPSDAAIFAVGRPDLELPERSATFHGRDIFAPIAARLALGLREDELGPRVEDAVRLADWAPTAGPALIRGRIIHVDTFGNLVSNIRRSQIDRAGGRGIVRVGGTELRGLALTYATVASGALLAYIGSSGHLEIAVRDGRADQHLGIGIGAEVAFEVVEKTG